MLEVAKKIRVLVIDDHAGVREGLRAVINAQPDMEIAGEAENGEDAVHQFKRLQPDVCVVDFNLPVLCGADVIAAIRQDTPAARCLVISAVNDDKSIRRAFRAGALGYLHKDMLRRELLPAVRAVYAGQKYIPADIARRLRETTNGDSDRATEH